MGGHVHGNAGRRDPEDPTPLLTRRAACGVLAGGALAAAGAVSGLLRTDPAAAEARRQELADLARRGGGFADDDTAAHVVVFGIDGLRPDALIVANTPNLDRLVERGMVSYRAFAGGNPVVNEQVTSSGPGWSSICTGVWVDQHGVESNGFLTPNYAEYPHFYQRILEQEPDALLASFVDWEPVNEIILHGMSSQYADVVRQGQPWTPATDLDSYTQRDREVVTMAAELIATDDPAVTFLHFDEVDLSGHSTEFAPDSPRYVAAIEHVDESIGVVLDAVEARDGRADERWGFVMTTDHGGLGNGHGGQTIEERKIPFVVSGDGVDAGEDPHGPGHTAVAPTVLTYLGLPISQEWGWQADAFGITA